MKKVARYLLVLALGIVMLCAMLESAPQPFARKVSQFPGNAKVTIYCQKTTQPCVNMGNGYLVECTVASLQRTLRHCSGVDGMSVSFAGNKAQFDEILRNFRVSVTSTFQDGNLVAVCGHSGQIAGGVRLDGNLVNIQVAYDGATVTVGYPLILDSY